MPLPLYDVFLETQTAAGWDSATVCANLAL